MGKAEEVEPSPLTFPACPWALPHPCGYRNIWPNLHCPSATWLTMALVPQCVLPIWEPLSSELSGPECREWELQIY